MAHLVVVFAEKRTGSRPRLRNAQRNAPGCVKEID
jgi:hypothetical protein